MATQLLERPITVKFPTRRARTFIERTFPDGAGMKKVEITPDIARELLAKNDDNRIVSEAKIAQYAADMAAGRWQLNGETVIVAEDGYLNNGQHRLLACIEADRPFLTFLVYGVARETRETLDQGKPRTAGNVLTMTGVKNANNMAGIGRLALGLERSDGKRFGRTNDFSSQEIVAYVREHLDELTAAFHETHSLPRSAATPTSLGLWFYILRDKGEKAKEYLRSVASGENISGNDPAYRVREKLLALGKLPRATSTEIVLRGWCFHRDGKPMQAVRYTGEFPKI